jgi:hypothetical protein
MIDKFMYALFGALDNFFDTFIPNQYERLKNNRFFSSKKRKRK